MKTRKIGLGIGLGIKCQLTDCQTKWKSVYPHIHTYRVSYTFSLECIWNFNFNFKSAFTIQFNFLPLLLSTKPISLSIQIVYSIRGCSLFPVSVTFWHSSLLLEMVFELKRWQTYSCKAISTCISTQPKQTKKNGEKKGKVITNICIWDLHYGGKWTIYIQTVLAKP